MTNEEFFKATNLRACIRVLETLCGEVELVSYGLAPNPNGFCYEIHETVSKDRLQLLDDALDSLSSVEEKELIELYL